MLNVGGIRMGFGKLNPPVDACWVEWDYQEYLKSIFNALPVVANDTMKEPKCYNEAKFDQGKPRYSLIEPGFLLELAKVMTIGAEKYSKDSWKTVPDAKQRYRDALLRHVYAEERVDKESGLSHLAHAAANIMFLFYLEGKDETTKG